MLCGDDEYCKLQALFLPVSYQWSLVELTCANKCIENNITQSYSITAYSKKTRCQWMNLKDKILLDSQRPAESSYLSPTTTHTLSTHTTHIGSPSIVTTSTPLHTPDQNKSKFTETMTKIPVCEFRKNNYCWACVYPLWFLFSRGRHITNCCYYLYDSGSSGIYNRFLAVPLELG